MATFPVYSVPATAAVSNMGGVWSDTVNGLSRILVSVWTMAACKVVIATVSAYDTYLTIKYAHSLDQYEENPIGRWLMSLDSGPVSDLQQIAAFVTAKFAGTILVVIVLQTIGAWRADLASMVAIPVTMFQLYLGYYLTIVTH